MQADSLYNVMTKSNKDKLFNIRLRPETRDEFAIAADLKGATMSGLIHQFIIKTIREEKERDPGAFKNVRTATGPYMEEEHETFRIPMVGKANVNDKQEVRPASKKRKVR